MKTFFVLTAYLLALVPLHAAQVTVFAAASLTDSLKQIAADYEKQSGDKIVFNFAGSGTLERQIEAGAPADVFISADEAKMDALAAKGLIVTNSRRAVAGNALVIITPLDNAKIQSPGDLTNTAVLHVALGEVKAVPAGSYAKSYLQSIGEWPTVLAKAVPCESVRAVLAAVETGNADAGFVYKTDAAISKKVKVVYEVPVAAGPKIVYPMALVKDSPQPEAARKFAAYLESEAGRAVFRKLGFTVP